MAAAGSHYPEELWDPRHPWIPWRAAPEGDDTVSGASRLLRGARVLARRETDGYFYPGHIIREVEDSQGCFFVEFARSRSPKTRGRLRIQATPFYDIVRYEDARRRRLVPGDRVLAPWEAGAERYGPGTVLWVTEDEAAPEACTRRGVLVNFWSGQTQEVALDVALKIPLPWSERIILELQMSPAARRKVVESSPDYPFLVVPGYRASGGYGLGPLGLCRWRRCPPWDSPGPPCGPVPVRRAPGPAPCPSCLKAGWPDDHGPVGGQLANARGPPTPRSSVA